MEVTRISSETRDKAILSFLEKAGWGGAVREPIPGDASFRRYERIYHAGASAILMDAPPEKEDVAPFVLVGTYLRSINLRAPHILAQDTKSGFLLLEDLGNDLFSRVLKTLDADALMHKERELYIAATSVLVTLYDCARKKPLPHIPVYDEALYLREVQLFSDWFLPAIAGEAEAEKLRPSFLATWAQTLRLMPELPVVAVLRDFHADNLLWLPDMQATDRVGLLDFQDAVTGSPAYDMVSFLEDARRDVLPQTVDACISFFLKETGLDPQQFADAYAIVGAQRNTKIIGIFTRLGKRDGKLHYQKFLPRVWGHLMHDLSHPKLASVQNWIMEHVPSRWHQGAPPLAVNT